MQIFFMFDFNAENNALHVDATNDARTDGPITRADHIAWVHVVRTGTFVSSKRPVTRRDHQSNRIKIKFEKRGLKRAWIHDDRIAVRGGGGQR